MVRGRSSRRAEGPHRPPLVDPRRAAEGLAYKRFASAYILAAVKPATGADFALVLPSVSSKAMSRFLADFSAQIAPDAHAVLVLDQAGWHGARALRVPDNITLVPLPPYSPELNPVERVWLYLRERYLSHRLLAALTLSSTPAAMPGTGSPPRRAGSQPSPPTRTSSRQQFREWV